jgi:hypothetical protein
MFAENSKESSPKKWLSWTSICFANGKLKIPAEIVPLSWFFMIQIFVRDLHLPSSSGIGPMKKFSIKISVFNLPPLHKLRGMNLVR